LLVLRLDINENVACRCRNLIALFNVVRTAAFPIDLKYVTSVQLHLSPSHLPDQLIEVTRPNTIRDMVEDFKTATQIAIGNQTWIVRV
jgi:hypothetical protein